MQRRWNVDVIRHAYVRLECQGRGVGSRLLEQLCHNVDRTILIGTWATAERAIRFHERHGFKVVGSDDAASLLRTYWNVPERQVATSVVLASPLLVGNAAVQLITEAMAARLP